MSKDIVIHGGQLIDGSGSPAKAADVRIVDDRIAEIGHGLTGHRMIDASDRVVAPGFIDIHTHYDAQVFWDPALTPSCYHGVTTVVAGNCGFSIAPTRPEHREVIAKTLENVEDMDVAALAEGIPWDFETFPQYLDSIRQRGSLLNFGAYLGHTALRLFAMGDAAYERPATDDEIEIMTGILREGLHAGACGFATSFAVTHRGLDGKPVPSRFAEKKEFEALCRVVGDVGKGIVHLVPGDQCSVPEIYDIQKATGVPFTWAALLTFEGTNYREIAEANSMQHAQGARVWPQVSSRELTFQFQMSDPFFLNQAECFAALMSQGPDARKAAYSDATWREQATREASELLIKPRWESIRVDETTEHESLRGRTIAEIAEQRGDAPMDVVCELALAEDLSTRFRQVVANDDEEGVAYLLQRDDCVLGLSDGGAHVGQLCDAPIATTLLGKWVRDKGALPLEKAIYKLTREPANLFGFPDRGELRQGMKADVVVFDPDTVDSGPLRRVRDFPANSERLTADQPSGMSHLLVNGCVIRENERSLHDELSDHPGEIVSPA